MNLSLSEKNILLILALAFAVSACLLMFSAERALDPDAGKDWWTLSFVNPSGTQTDFTLENHSSSTHFTYRVTSDERVIIDEPLDIPRGTSHNISLTPPAESIRTITMTVTSSTGETKTIYKNL